MIEINHLSKKYGSREALSDVSLKVDKGELFGLIGPDGAGKTTLMRILVSLLIPDNGRATIAGYDVVKDYREIRKMVGYMPGRFSLYHDLTVEENLQFFASVFGVKIRDNFHLIEEIYSQLLPFKNRRAGKLSGGMKQKLALSCALIHQPDLLVLDEPTTGVDAVSRNEFWNMLARLKAEGITIFVSTPYMDEASRCERVALIGQGQIMSVDSPQKIVKQFGKALWKVRAGETYRLLCDLKSWPETVSVYPFGRYLHLMVSEPNQKEDILQFLEERKHRPEIFEDFSNIEDVFMDLMAKQ